MSLQTERDLVAKVARLEKANKKLNVELERQKALAAKTEKVMKSAKAELQKNYSVTAYAAWEADQIRWTREKELAEEQLAAEKQRADAAVSDIRELLLEGGAFECDYCKNQETCVIEALKPGCKYWQWRGVCAENSGEEQHG